MKIQKPQYLLTKYFYCGNHLHYQILIQTDTDCVMYDIYSDYGIYKTEFAQIEKILNDGKNVFKLLDKKKNLETTFANVA